MLLTNLSEQNVTLYFWSRVKRAYQTKGDRLIHTSHTETNSVTYISKLNHTMTTTSNLRKVRAKEYVKPYTYQYHTHTGGIYRKKKAKS